MFQTTVSYTVSQPSFIDCCAYRRGIYASVASAHHDDIISFISGSAGLDPPYPRELLMLATGPACYRQGPANAESQSRILHSLPKAIRRSDLCEPIHPARSSKACRLPQRES